MNELEMKELERILTSDEELQPMTGFSTRVMRAVKEEAAVPPPIAFPWARFLPGFLLNLGLLLGAAMWIILQPDTSPSAPPIAVEWLSGPQAQGLLWAGLTVIGTGVLAWLATRWSAPRKATLFY